MTMTVTDCAAAELEIDESSIEISHKAPRGLASIPDTLQMREPPPKPNILIRSSLNLALIFLHMTAWTVLVTNWAVKSFFGLFSRQKALYHELHRIAMTGNQDDVKRFLAEHSEKPFAAGYLFSEFLSLPELYSHLPRILEGANICLLNDKGFFCRRWSDHHDAYKRKSSHRYQGDECYGIGHFVFWKDPDNNTRFQFEKSPLRGFFSSINHSIDYLRYLRDNEQQGVVGSSPHTEDYCLYVRIDTDDFTSRIIDSFS